MTAWMRVTTAMPPWDRLSRPRIAAATPTAMRKAPTQRMREEPVLMVSSCSGVNSYSAPCCIVCSPASRRRSSCIGREPASSSRARPGSGVLGVTAAQVLPLRLVLCRLARRLADLAQPLAEVPGLGAGRVLGLPRRLAQALLSGMLGLAHGIGGGMPCALGRQIVTLGLAARRIEGPFGHPLGLVDLGAGAAGEVVPGLAHPFVLAARRRQQRAQERADRKAGEPDHERPLLEQVAEA